MNPVKALAASLLLVSPMAFAIDSHSPINPNKTVVIGTGWDEGADTYYGVTDGGKNIKVNGLEWIRWDVTRTLSLNDALAAFPDYRLATGKEIAGLFDHYISYNDEPFSWTSHHDSAHSQRSSAVGPLDSSRTEFTVFQTYDYDKPPTHYISKLRDDFGITYEYDTPSIVYWDVQAVFQSSAEGDTSDVGVARSSHGSGVGGQDWENVTVDWYNAKSYDPRETGIALVRASTPEIDVAAAPLSLALLMGLFAINRERRLRKSR